MDGAKRVVAMIRNWIVWLVRNPLDDLRLLRDTKQAVDDGNESCIENVRAALERMGKGIDHDLTAAARKLRR